MRIKFEDALFWILMAAIVAVVLWLLSGSPPETNGIISAILFVAVSELLIWRYLFEIDKKGAVSFVKIKNKIDNLNENFIHLKEQINTNHEKTNEEFNELKNLIKRR